MLTYRAGILHVEGVPVPEIVAPIGTPAYIYSLDEITRRVRAYRNALPHALIAYAYKANAQSPVIRHLAQLGCGADVVSGEELRAALAAGVPPERIVFNGNAKLDEEIHLAVRVRVRSLNVDAREEIPRIARITAQVRSQARITLRVNPGLDVHTHPHLRVGAPGSHFGIPPEDVLPAAREVVASPWLDLHGIHLHVGSQLLQLEELETVAREAARWVRTLRDAGFPVTEVDLGGGLGIPYDGAPGLDPMQVAERWRPYLDPLDVQVVVEPGRWLVGPAGILVLRVVQVKRAWGRTFVVVDGGMNVLLRPALYGARHRIWPVVQGDPEIRVDVVGPNCESADVLGRDYTLPPLSPGDLVAVLDVGAYGRSMANRYNLRPLPREAVLHLMSND